MSDDIAAPPEAARTGDRTGDHDDRPAGPQDTGSGSGTLAGAVDTVQQHVRRGRRSRTGHALVRVGIGSRAVVYVALAVLVLQLAFGSLPDDADQAGALREIGSTSAGRVLLWLLAIGAACYVLWRWSRAAAPAGDDEGVRDRVLAAIEGAAYVPIALGAAFTAAGDPQSAEQGDRYRSVSATVMAQWPAGRWLIGLVGLVVLGVGLYLASQGPRRSFENDLDLRGPARLQQAVVTLGVVGSTARGVVIAAAGVLVIYAAVTADPDKAGGIDAALRALAEQAVGPWLLLVVAVGLASFGGFAVCEAWFRRVD